MEALHAAAVKEATESGDSIRVVVRVRPPNERELSQGFSSCVAAARPGGCEIAVAGKTFTFDHICDETSGQARRPAIGSRCACLHAPPGPQPKKRPAQPKKKASEPCRARLRQADIFAQCKGIADGLLEGYHGCIIAYGQTGAGKTFTMQGPTPDGEPDGGAAPLPAALSLADSCGIIPRVRPRPVPPLSRRALWVPPRAAASGRTRHESRILTQVLGYLFSRLEEERAAAVSSGSAFEFTCKRAQRARCGPGARTIRPGDISVGFKSNLALHPAGAPTWKSTMSRRATPRSPPPSPPASRRPTPTEATSLRGQVSCLLSSGAGEHLGVREDARRGVYAEVSFPRRC